MSGTPPLKIGVLMNEHAGAVEAQGTDAIEQTVFNAFTAAQFQPLMWTVSGSELRAAAEKALAELRAGRLDLIAVVGGDGSIRAVASVFAGTGIPLGIVPMGTLNHFARDLKIPLDMAEAVALIASGSVRDVDIGAANGTVFINNSSLGFYPHLVRARERWRKRRHLPKWLAMLAAAIPLLKHLPLFRFRVRMEGASETCRSPIVLVGNNEYQIALPGLGRRMRLDGAELAVYIAKAQTLAGLIGLGLRAAFRRFRPERDLMVLKGKTADIHTRKRRLLAAIDGEVELLHPPLHYEIRPKALRVFASEGHIP